MVIVLGMQILYSNICLVPLLIINKQNINFTLLTWIINVAINKVNQNQHRLRDINDHLLWPGKGVRPN